MTLKQSIGLNAPNGSMYVVPTDGAGNLAYMNSADNGSDKTLIGRHAPDGSIYATLTDGAGNLR